MSIGVEVLRRGVLNHFAGYITATSSASSLAVPMSWVMRIKVVLVSLLDPLQDVHQVGLGEQVQSGGRLIQHHQLRIGGQGHGDGCPLPHTAAQFKGVAEAAIQRQPDEPECRLHLFHGRFTARHAVLGEKRFRHLVLNPQDGVEGVLRQPATAPSWYSASRRNASSSRVIKSFPSRMTASPVGVHIAGKQAQDRLAKELFPEPDSPMITSVRPRVRSLKPSTACTVPAAVRKCRIRSST